MTVKELLALVERWREMAGRHRECGPNGAMLAEVRERCADELAPIATALCAEVEATREIMRGMIAEADRDTDPFIRARAYLATIAKEPK